MQNFQHRSITVSEAVKYQPQVTKIFLSWGSSLLCQDRLSLPHRQPSCSPQLTLAQAVLAQARHLQMGSASSRAVWSTAGQTPPQEPQGQLGDNAGSPLVFVLGGSHDLWEARPLEKSDSDHFDVFAACLSPLLLQPGISPLLPTTSDYQLRNGFKWRLIPRAGAWHLHVLLWAAGWDGGGEGTSSDKLAPCRPLSTSATGCGWRHRTWHRDVTVTGRDGSGGWPWVAQPVALHCPSTCTSSSGIQTPGRTQGVCSWGKQQAQH